MTLRELENALLSLGAQDPRAEALIIIEHYFSVPAGIALCEKDRDYSSPMLDSVLEKRKERIPLQYRLGEWEFMGKSFCVSQDCLIPRPDTEILVEKALEIGKIGDNVADFCTGSGCIGLSLLIYGDFEKMTLVDISKGALEMARKNAKRHGLLEKCTFILGDVCKDMPNAQYDLIVSNPPYIPTSDVDCLSPEVKKEPRLALDGGADGLDIIRFLIGDGLSYLAENGKMLIEFGYDQGEIMSTLLREKCDTGSIKSYEILYDYGKNPRVAVIYK